jgi:DNA primase
MAVSQIIINQIRERSSIEQIVSEVVTLQPSGRAGSLKGLCPFHQEDTPSFTVNTHKNLFYCFGCQEGGDVFAFVQKTRGVSFMEAMRDLANSCGIQLEESSPEQIRRYKKIDSLYDVCKIAMEFYHNQYLFSKEAEKAREYLTQRGISSEAITDFNIGYAPPDSNEFISFMHRQKVDVKQLVETGLAKYRDSENRRRGVYALFRNRIMIPIRNNRGKVVAFGGRKMPGDETTVAKYMNSPETIIYKKSQTLYGLSFARASIQRKMRVIIVEGYFDVIALHKNGFKEAIASCGTALTEEHLQILRPLTRRAIAMFDNDEAGIRAAERSLPLFWEAGIEPLRLSLGDAKDPDEFFLKADASIFEEKLKVAEPLLSMRLGTLIGRIGKSPGAVQQIIEDVGSLLRRMPSAARDASISLMASRLGVMEESIRSQVGREKKEKQQPQSPDRIVSIIIRDLLWFLIHYPVVVREQLSAIDPTIISENRNILFVIAMLMQGKNVSDVLDNITDDSLKKLLLHQSVEETRYQNEEVEEAVRQIVNRFQIKHLKDEIRHQQNEITDLNNNGEVFELIEAMNRLQSLRSDYEKLHNQIQSINSL